MRGILLSLAVAGILAAAAPATPSASVVTATPTVSAAGPLYALQIPDKQIEITVADRGGVRWYRSPVWVAIGALAVVVILLLVVIAARGGGTTVIKE
jgi:hypothetical protein